MEKVTKIYKLRSYSEITNNCTVKKIQFLMFFLTWKIINNYIFVLKYNPNIMTFFNKRDIFKITFNNLLTVILLHRVTHKGWDCKDILKLSKSDNLGVKLSLLPSI